jgi:hypothetical protein
LSGSDPGYLGPHNRPDNAPICPVLSNTNRAFITLRGGGLLVVDAKATPMTIVAEYGNQLVGRDGCGGLQNKNDIFLNGSTGTLQINPTEFTLYYFKDRYPLAPFSAAQLHEFLPVQSAGPLPESLLQRRLSGTRRARHGPDHQPAVSLAVRPAGE